MATPRPIRSQRLVRSPNGDMPWEFADVTDQGVIKDLMTKPHMQAQEASLVEALTALLTEDQRAQALRLLHRDDRISMMQDKIVSLERELVKARADVEAHKKRIKRVVADYNRLTSKVHSKGYRAAARDLALAKEQQPK